MPTQRHSTLLACLLIALFAVCFASPALALFDCSSTGDPSGDADLDGVVNQLEDLDADGDCDDDDSDGDSVPNYLDTDDDGDGTSTAIEGTGTDADSDGWDAYVDCDDGPATGATTFPGAATNDDTGASECMRDADGDDWGEIAVSSPILAGTDCDDGDPLINPGAAEICDAQDNDCNGVVDEGWNRCGNPLACPVVDLCNLSDDDCDAQVDEGGICGSCTPAVVEICDGCDDDCNGIADDPPPGGFPVSCAPPQPVAVGSCVGPSPPTTTLSITVTGTAWSPGAHTSELGVATQTDTLDLQLDLPELAVLGTVSYSPSGPLSTTETLSLTDVEIGFGGSTLPVSLPSGSGAQDFTLTTTDFLFAAGQPVVVDVSGLLGVPGARLSITPRPWGGVAGGVPSVWSADVELFVAGQVPSLPPTAAWLAVLLFALIGSALLWRARRVATLLGS